MQIIWRPYQEQMIRFAMSRPRCALWASMGSGKTASVLAALDAAVQIEGHSALVVAPKRVALHVWPREAAKWDRFQSLRVVPIVGSASERIDALNQAAHIHTISYDNLPWLVKTLSEGGRGWKWRTLVADEATRLKGFRLKGGARRAFALSKAVQHISRLIELTGTPAPNGLIDLWAQVWFLDQGARLGRTFTAFRDRWFDTDYFGKPIPKAGAAKQISERVKDICLTIDARDWFSVEEPIVRDVEVELPASAREAYRHLEREFFAEFAGREIDAASAATKSAKCLQVANGTVYATDDESARVVPVHDEKLDALDSIIEETNDRVLVSYHFRCDRDRIMARFPHAIDLAQSDGLERALRGEGSLWLAHPKSLGHGVDGLQEHCNVLVFYSRSWNLEEHQQIIERIGPMRQAQAGLRRPVYVYQIVAQDTIDVLLSARLAGKGSLQTLLLEAMKRREEHKPLEAS